MDTNVMSEPLRSSPEPLVSKWLNSQALETLFLSAITVAELRYGIRTLPTGRRRGRLSEALETQILPMFTGRVLAFDVSTSEVYAELMAKARLAGRAISRADGYIAATAVANAMAVATRDTSPFEVVGLKTVNPWRA